MRHTRNRRLSRRDDGDTPNCGDGGGADTFFALRVASVFIVLIGSLLGALFPVLARRSKSLKIPTSVYDFAKYFGSGVIIATAFIHLLDPAIEELGDSDCLDPKWGDYPYALALTLLSVFATFIVEIIAFRWGSAKLAAIGVTNIPRGHGVITHDPDDPQFNHGVDEEKLHADSASVVLAQNPTGFVADSAATKMLGIAILEFGILLHSVFIGLTLAVDPNFKILFIVIVFHQTFEGLGVGSRLAYLDLPKKYSYVPIVGALLYGITTPIGIAVGLGIRTTYNPFSTTASIVSGILDSISAGILIYTGLVELLAHEFLFSKDMMNGSNSKIIYAVTWMLLGCGIMALLGKWA
ncbi:Zinc/iron permease [Cristinia sonorae]|uniref:Zinc/iron permease n=1 Tax=Cristinia sonorae TaxID=1940300 RepID=A0A8K0UUQ0_9AGAR|nr:Zinc/iron permease [Cristinia sonorae]